MAIIQIPSTWSAAHRNIMFEVDNPLALCTAVNNGGKLRIQLAAPYAFDYPLLQRVYIDSGTYKGFHLCTAVRTASPNFYIDTATDWIGSSASFSTLFCWNYKLKISAGYPNYDKVTLKQAFYRPDGRVIFDIQENVKTAIKITQPVNGIDTSLFTWFKIEIQPDADLQSFLTGEGLNVFDVYGYDSTLYDFRALNSTADQSVINAIAAGTAPISDVNPEIFTTPRLNVFSRVFDSRVFTFFVNSIASVFNPILSPRTNDWINRYTAATGNAPNDTLISAVNQWFETCEPLIASLKILRANWYIANNGSVTGAMVPLVNQRGSATDTAFNFVSGDFTTALAFTPNGVNKYIEIGFNPNSITEFGLNDAGVMIYPRINSQQSTGGDIGSNPSSTIAINARNASDQLNPLLNSGGATPLTGVTDSRGILHVQRNNAASVQVFKNEILIDTTPSASTTKPTVNLLMYRTGGTYYKRANYGYMLSKWLNTVEYVTILNATKTLMAAIGRTNF